MKHAALRIAALVGQSVPAALSISAAGLPVRGRDDFAGRYDIAYTPTRFERLDIKLDGIMDEAAWRETKPIPSWYQQCPDEGRPPTETTEMRLAYDRDFLYLGARLDVLDPATLLCRSLERDSHSLDQDAIGLVLDTLNDRRTASGFFITPAGVRTDGAVANDGETFPPLKPWNVDWNTFWDAAVRQEEDAWTAEIRIPFSSLRFSPGPDGSVEMGLILWRYVAHHLEYDVFPPVPNRWLYSAFKPSQALRIVFRDLRPVHSLHVRPSILGGRVGAAELDPPAGRYEFRRRNRFDLGLDIKYGLTSDLALDLTVNTDFAQIEADDQMINLTRFPLFYPEKRGFFQERADLFSFRLPGGSQSLFHTRTIGIVDEEYTVPILGGARIAGRIGSWDVGLIEMQTRAAMINGEERPGENFGVLRVKRILAGDGSYAGGLFTSRMDARGRTSVLAAFDADIRITGFQFFRLQAAASREPGAAPGRSNFLCLVWSNQVRRGFTSAASLMHIGTEFNPALGFLFRNGINRAGGRLGYTWFPEPGQAIQNHGLNDRWEAIWAIAAKRFETLENTLSWQAQFRSGGTLDLEFKATEDRTSEAFELGRIVVHPARYRFLHGEGRFETSSGRAFRLGFEAQGGGYYGGWLASGTISPAWTLSRRLTLKLEYSYGRAAVPNGRYLAHIARLRVQTALSRELSANAFLQYNGDVGEASANIRLRWNPREGVDLYVVYNEGRNTERPYEIPRLLRIQNRGLLVKFTYAFVR